MYQRNNIWYVSFTDSITGKKVVRSTGESDRKKALLKEAEIQQEVAESVSRGPTLSESLEYTWRVSWQHNRDGERQYRQGLRLVERMGDPYISEITTDDLLELRESLVEDGFKDGGCSQATANRYMAAVRKILTDARKRGVLTGVPHVPLKREKAGRVRVITKEEELALIEALEAPYDDFVAVLLDTGMRLSEALRISTLDYDAERRSLTAWKVKNDHPRTIPTTDRVHRIIMSGPQPETFGGIAPWQVETAWRKARRSMGLQDDAEFVPHACRHTAASRMVRARVSLYVVKEILGHRTIKTTERYAHLDHSALREGISALEG